MSETTKRLESTPEWDAVRERVRAIIAGEKLQMVVIAKKSGIAIGTLSNFMGRTYSGDQARVANELQKWLDSRVAARSVVTRARAPGFVQTRTADEFYRVLSHAQHAPDIAVIAGNPGLGKTMAVRGYQAASPNVWVVTAHPSLASPYALLSELADVLGVTERSPDRKFSAILHRIRGAGALIAVDEAHHLHISALEQLRALHDLAGAGIALVGSEDVYARLQGMGRKSGQAQLTSRVGMRVTRARPYAADVATLADAWGITDDAMRKRMAAMARGAGALRLVTKTLLLALTIAAGEVDGDAEPTLTLPAMEMAWQQLGQIAVGEPT
jgi:DNA transposition AAA+ family ATPase